jgi:hypothetical protein
MLVANFIILDSFARTEETLINQKGFEILRADIQLVKVKGKAIPVTGRGGL